jgi:hypothetical protein
MKTRNFFYNGPAEPTAYDSTWQIYTNLTAAQIAWFESQPADLLNYASTRRWLAEISGTTVAGVPLGTQDRDQAKIAQIKQAFDNGALTGSVSFSDAAGNTQSVTAAMATQIYNGVVAFVQGTYMAYAALKAGIQATPPTVTSRAQIDAAFAEIAPGSPSAR